MYSVVLQYYYTAITTGWVITSFISVNFTLLFKKCKFTPTEKVLFGGFSHQYFYSALPKRHITLSFYCNVQE